MKKIAIVSCNKWIGKITEDILLRDALIQKGYDAEIISWEDKSIDYSLYSAFILRSVWGYQNNYSEFKNWLLNLKHNNCLLFNSPDIVLNNIRKDKQFEILDDNNIPHIDTRFVYDRNSIGDIKSKTVIKPIISGSGENTHLISSSSDLESINLDFMSHMDNGIMIEPFIEEVKNGELSIIYIDGINTHSMVRYPGVFTEKKKPFLISDIPQEAYNLAKKVSNIKEFNGYLYMRVDMVMVDASPLIMEVELSEPDLLFKYVSDEKVKKDGINTLASSLVRRMK